MKFAHTLSLCLALAGSQLGCKSTLIPCGPASAPPPPPQYLRVDYTGQRTTGGNSPAEISGTPTYQSERTKWKSVALRVPNNCATETAAKVTGAASSSQAILESSCGVWLKELEAALSREGYRVVSWDALHRAESAGDMSTYQIAQKLGVDVVFLINSLEPTPQALADSGEQKLAFFQSNAVGDPLAKAQLDPARSKWLVDFVRKRVDASKAEASGVTAHAAMLDLTAITATSGEAMWFYRRALTGLPKALKDSDAMSFLFAYKPSATVPGLEHWWPVAPANQVQAIPEAPAPPELQSEVTLTSSASGGPEDEARAIKLELVRTVVKDFVHSFKTGQTSAPAAAPPT
jgi:hypothetical protein